MASELVRKPGLKRVRIAPFASAVATQFFQRGLAVALHRDVGLRGQGQPHLPAPRQQRRVGDQLLRPGRGSRHCRTARGARAIGRLGNRCEHAIESCAGHQLLGLRPLERGGIEHQVRAREIDVEADLALREPAEPAHPHVDQQEGEERHRQPDRDQPEQLEAALGGIALGDEPGHRPVGPARRRGEQRLVIPIHMLPDTGGPRAAR